MPEPWARHPGEPALWFGRFDVYRLAGAGRSLAGAYHDTARVVGPVPVLWYDRFERWQWRERAALWDQAQAEHTGAAEREQDARARGERITVLKAARSKALAELQTMRVTDGAWPRVMATLTAVTSQLRVEGA